MGEVVTLARASVSVLNRDRALELFRKAFLDGEIGSFAKSITLWESNSAPGRFLLVARYASEDDAERAIEASGNDGVFTELVQVLKSPADIRRYRIAGQQGKLESDANPGSYLSLIIRSSDPGLGWDLNAELARILDEIALIPGFLGSFHGRSATVHEEVMSIALWQNEESYRASVPSHHLFELNAYVRVV